MHVLFDARLLHRPLSGLERVQKNLLRELAMSPKITRLSALVMRGTKLPADIPENARPVEVQTTEDILAILLADTDRDRPDVYHMTFFPDRSPKDLWLPIAAHASVVEVHDAILNRHPEYHPDARSFAGYDAFVRRLVRSCDRLLVHSKSVVKEVVDDLGGDGRIADVAPLAVDPALAEPLVRADAQKRRARLGVREGYFMVLGKDYPHKDHPTLLRAFARTSGVELVCAGSKGWHKGGIATDDLCKSLGIEGRARWFQGLSDDDVKALLQGALALVYPSREEGFGLPPIEAMALGTPVLAAASMSIPEVCGDAAWLFPTGDHEALFGLMRRIQAGGDEVHRLVARGKERAREYSWKRCAEQTIVCYEHALAAAKKKHRSRPVLDKGVRSVLRAICTSPFHDGVAMQEWITRATHYERHARAVEGNRDDILRQLLELKKSLGMPVDVPMPPPVPQPPHPHETPAGKRPRWSLKRRIGKIKAALKKRPE